MRQLLACTCLTPVAILATAPLHAETVIDTKRTTAASTSTIKNGAADDIRIAAAGSIVPAGGAAVTLDSANSVKNEGTIQITGANDATGIHVNAGVAGSITNSGKIILDESYTPTDGDKDGDLDGPFAQGARRVAIRTAGGFTGAINHTGSIEVEGNDSAGIQLGGPLTGALTSSGSISVLGDRGYGVRAQDVSGAVKLSGAITVQGANSVGVALDGNVGGALVIQGAVTATGYRSAAGVVDQSKLDADDLLQGGPAVRIAGNVAGGVLFDVRPKDVDPNDKDEDKDGIEDAKEGNAVVTAYGAAPAVQIGSAMGAVAIGAVQGNAAGHGVVVNGDILGSGVYKGVDGNGIAIGGLGGAATVAGGITVNGSVGAKSADANAVALRIGAGASVPAVRVGGAITASGGALANSQVRAISIEAGSTVRSIVNSGKISAAASGDGIAAAIADKSGNVTLVENSGAISAQAGKPGAERAAAIDLSANSSGVTVRQTAVAAGVAAPSISGSILLGAGDDLVDIADGSVSGTARFGAGDNRLQLSGDATWSGEASFGAGVDTVTLAGSSAMSGKLDFADGGADTLTLGGTSRFTGTLANSAGLAVSLNGGTLNIAGAGPVQLASLTTTGASAIGVTIDPETGAATQYQVGAASFGQGTKVNVFLSSVGEAEGDYVIVKAGALTGGGNLTAAAAALPYMFKGSVSANQAAGEVSLQIARKSATELGLTRSQSSAYDAVFNALDQDEAVAASFLSIADPDQFRLAVQQMLPEHAGGLFETVTQGSRATARLLADPDAMVSDQGGWGFWLQQVVWGTSKDRDETASFETFGWGGAGGVEVDTGLGHLGLALAFLGGHDDDDEFANEISTDQYELAAYWRGRWGGFAGFARVSAAQVDLTGLRRFEGVAGTDAVERTARSEWGGRLYSGSAGLSYAFHSGRLSLRPSASVDYYRFDEDGYSEAGGGDAFNLVVDERSSDQFAVTGAIAAGLDLTGGYDPETGFLRTELELGRRQIVGGELGATTARFKDGEDFTLLPEERESGWVGKLRLLGGNAAFRAGGELNVEQQQGRAAVAFRASLSVGL